MWLNVKEKRFKGEDNRHCRHQDYFFVPLHFNKSLQRLPDRPFLYCCKTDWLRAPYAGYWRGRDKNLHLAFADAESPKT